MSMCEVFAKYENEDVITLAIGLPSVIKFHNLAKKGIPGAISTEFDFNCNVDVVIKGDALLEFIKTKYRGKYNAASKKISADKTYTIICFDLS